jgi:hypothetical protein
MMSKRWKEHDTPAERIAERRLHAVLMLQPAPTRRIARWVPHMFRVLTGWADKSRTAGACRWRRVLRIKRLIREMACATP